MHFTPVTAMLGFVFIIDTTYRVVDAGLWCRGLTCLPVTEEIAGSNPVRPARKTMELFPDAKKLESDTKDPCGSFLFVQGLTNKALTQKGFGTINSYETLKTMELFIKESRNPIQPFV